MADRPHVHPTSSGRPGRRAAVLVLALVPAAACAALSQALGVEPPVFTIEQDRASTLRYGLPSIDRPRGSAIVTLWTRVSNPNGFAFTLSTLEGTLALEGRDMADVALPLGLPLQARGDTVLPLEINVPIPDLDQLGALGEAILTGGTVAYELEGTVGVDAGPLGEPTFGPRRWLAGSLDVRTILEARP